MGMSCRCAINGRAAWVEVFVRRSSAKRPPPDSRLSFINLATPVRRQFAVGPMCGRHRRATLLNAARAGNRFVVLCCWPWAPAGPDRGRAPSMTQIKPNWLKPTAQISPARGISIGLGDNEHGYMSSSLHSTPGRDTIRRRACWRKRKYREHWAACVDSGMARGTTTVRPLVHKQVGRRARRLGCSTMTRTAEGRRTGGRLIVPATTAFFAPGEINTVSIFRFGEGRPHAHLPGGGLGRGGRRDVDRDDGFVGPARANDSLHLLDLRPASCSRGGVAAVRPAPRVWTRFCFPGARRLRHDFCKGEG